MMTALLVVLILLFLHPFVLYPLLLRLVPARRPVAAPPGTPLPRVALVICALNEEKILRAKLDNSVALDYPKELFTIYVVNDGSTDRTSAIAHEFEGRGVQVIDREQRRGKVRNLNEVITSLGEEIVVSSDANVIYDPQAIRHLVARFGDPKVGCVSGKVILQETADALQSGEENYYSIEWFLQEKGSDVYSMCGADGAMHAFRRALFVQSPNDTLIEDFVLPMTITRAGYRAVFEPKALAWERGPETLQEEFRRKVRIAAGAAQALVRGNGLPGNCPLSFWFVWTSHKLLRWLSPLTGLAILLVAACSAEQWLSQLVLSGFALLAVLALIRWKTGWSHPLLNAPFYFFFGQVAIAWGLLKGMAGKQSVLWAKANR